MDTIVGGSGNDTINATDTTYTGLDKIDGGAGIDTLNISDVAGSSVVLSKATVTNVEKLVLSSSAGLNGGSADISSLTSLTNATFALNAATAAQAVTAATTTAVTISSPAAEAVTVKGSGGALNITAGAGAIKVGDIAAAAGDANAITSATIKGGTSVDVTDNSDATTAGAIGSKLTTVSLDGNTGAATLTGKGLTNVTIANGVATSDVTIANTTAGHTQNLTVNNNATGLVITDANATTVNIASTVKASAVALAAAAATTINASGTVGLTLDALGSNYTALTTLNIAGAGGVTANVTGALLLTDVNASTSTGANNITIDATKATFEGGAGADTVTIAAVPTKAIAGGAGTDELVWNAAGNFNASASTKVSGFETLGAGANVNGATLDATGFSTVHVGVATAGDVTFANAAAGTALVIDAAVGNNVSYALQDATGTSDAVAVTIGNATTAGLDLSAKTLTLTGIETVSINSTGTGTGTNKVQLVDAQAKALTITGGEALTATGTLSALTKVDASATTKGVDLSSLATANAVTEIGGAGADKLVASAGMSTLTGGAGNDTFAFTANANGNTYATVTDFAKGDIIDLSGLETAGKLNLAVTDGNFTKISLASTAGFADYLNAATAGDGSTNAKVSSFQFGGDTYVVADRNVDSTFQNGATTGDQVIKLAGLVDLTHAVVGADSHLTLA